MAKYAGYMAKCAWSMAKLKHNIREIEKKFQKNSYYCITFPILNSLDDFPNVKCHTVISNLLYETMQPYYFNSLHPIRILLMKISLTRGPVYFVTSFFASLLVKNCCKNLVKLITNQLCWALQQKICNWFRTTEPSKVHYDES